MFYEEELDVPLVLFNEVLDHVLRIDRIFRQPQGHLLLIGVRLVTLGFLLVGSTVYHFIDCARFLQSD